MRIAGQRVPGASCLGRTLPMCVQTSVQTSDRNRGDLQGCSSPTETQTAKAERRSVAWMAAYQRQMECFVRARVRTCFGNRLAGECRDQDETAARYSLRIGTPQPSVSTPGDSTALVRTTRI